MKLEKLRTGGYQGGRGGLSPDLSGVGRRELFEKRDELLPLFARKSARELGDPLEVLRKRPVKEPPARVGELDELRPRVLLGTRAQDERLLGLKHPRDHH